VACFALKWQSKTLIDIMKPVIIAVGKIGLLALEAISTEGSALIINAMIAK